MIDSAISDGPHADATIAITLRRIRAALQLVDPSPFHERDLDEDAEAISSIPSMIPLQKRLQLIIHCRRTSCPPIRLICLRLSTTTSPTGSTRASGTSELFFRDGRIALSIGLGFLIVCIVLREFVFAFGHGAVAEIASEGLLILGWVAMWRPLEIFLYDWWPIRHRCRLFAKLSDMPVIVRAP